MADFIFLMHNDGRSAGDWAPYLLKLNQMGCFQGGSGIGRGDTFRLTGEPAPVTGQIGGFIRVEAESLDAARRLLDGNPVYEAGGTVEIRELPRED